ncbi:MAG: hypothetical protein JKY65_33695 [Planctomycetes bacterium]|nr:hypothetical protein [Planctomycetota bacterium]
MFLRPQLLLPALSVVLLFGGSVLEGCASRPQPGKARVLDYRQDKEAQPKAPEAKALRPTAVRFGSDTPVRPPWKGERVRALDIDRGARSEVEAARGRAGGDPAIARAEARATKARKAREKVGRRRFERALDKIQATEQEKRERLLAEAAERRTTKYAKVRQRAYLAAALRRAGRDNPVDLIPASRQIVVLAGARARACAQLHAEQVVRVRRTRRMTLAALGQGVALSSGRLELRHQVRRLTEAALIWDQAEAELIYARAVAVNLDAEWTLATSKDDPGN